jgi:predicted NAD/FAD-binding protein
MSVKPLNIAVVGTGIAGLSAAWLLSLRHRVEMFEREGRKGGHANTVDIGPADRRRGVDAGFIVYNETNYPNLVALFDHLDVATERSDMSFSVSLRGGRFEYSSDVPHGLLAQPTNALRPAFWSMLHDLRRFYRTAPGDLRDGRLAGLSLGTYLSQQGYGTAFVRDHLLPMGAAIWSAHAQEMRAFPAEAFVRFFESHGLLELRGRPAWRTVSGGSRNYIGKLTASFADRIRLANPVRRISRSGTRVTLEDAAGVTHLYDHVVIATHADQALAMLHDPSARERTLLGAMRYTRNPAIMHTDPALMPRRRGAWASWNYLTSDNPGTLPQLSYWMNRLQNLDSERDIFVTLNPHSRVPTDRVLARFEYDHPLYDTAALAAQKELWSLQGVRNTWFCGSYFGYGFHEDALQAGLAVAETLGGVTRPWRVAEPSGRLHLAPPKTALAPASALRAAAE